MRIASYNLFEGAQDTYPQLQEFVAQQQPGVMCLQEANKWNDGSPSRLEDFAATTGLAHYVYGDSNTRFKLATFSRVPILSSEVVTDGLWHAAIKTTVEDAGEELDIWNIHLDPKGEDERLAEVERLLGLIDPNRRVLITGDVNSLSAADHYPSTMIGDLRAKGIAKFGVDSLRFDVTKRFARAGFVDVAAKLGVLASTVPTPANQDKFHAAKMRLDYMFASARLAKAVRRLAVPKDALTNVISDHYPNVLDSA